MSVRSFLDTSVLVYTDDHSTLEKQSAALDIVERARLEGWGVLSTQVLQEYFVASTRKLGVPVEIARRKVELFSRLDLVLLDTPDIIAAIDLQRLHGFSFWDALVVRAAKQAGCAVLLTEDLQHGQQIDGLEIVDPFHAPR
jgi:predicted nucleic acid-binding protein